MTWLHCPSRLRPARIPHDALTADRVASLRSRRRPLGASTTSATSSPSTPGARLDPRTLRRYKREVLRLLTEVAFGSGALAVIGGTVVIIAFLTFFTGTVVGLQGYSALNQIGTSAFTGFVSAYFNTREIAPLVAGAGAVGDGRLRLHRPARRACGSPRRSTPSRSWRVPSLPFLVTTRVIAGFIAVIPLYVIGLVGVVLRHPADRHELLQAVVRHLRPLLQPVPAAEGRPLLVRQGAGLRRRDHPDPLLLRLQRQRRSGRRRRRRRPARCATRSSCSRSSTLFLTLAIWGSTTTVRIAG